MPLLPLLQLSSVGILFLCLPKCKEVPGDFQILNGREAAWSLLSVHQILLCSSMQLGELQTYVEQAMRKDMD